MDEYICQQDNCNIVAVFGYDNDRNISCAKHMEYDMQFTFRFDDFEKIPIFNMKKQHRVCIYDNCLKQASINFFSENQRLFCSDHQLEMMVNVTRKKLVIENEYANLLEEIRLKYFALPEDFMTRICKFCKHEVYISEFTIKRNKCKACSYKDSCERVNLNHITFLKNLHKQAKNNANTKRENGRSEAGEFDITHDDLLELFEQQNGKCYYSYIPLNFCQLSDWQCSLERKNTNKGYVIDNIALICAEFQGANQWSNNKFDELIKLLQINHEKQIVEWQYTKQKKYLQRNNSVLVNGNSAYKCNICKEIKLASDFYIYNKTTCKSCRKTYNEEYAANPKGYLIHKLKSMRAASKNRNHDSPQFDVDDLIDMFESQGGLCAYSGIPMTFGTYKDTWWTCSPERKNVKIGYTKENVVLICHEFNTSDQTNKALDTTTISGGSYWNKEKIDFLKNYTEMQEFFENLTL